MTDHYFEIDEQSWASLLQNGHAVDLDPAFDASPVVKLIQPDGKIIFLLAEINPSAPNLAFGLMDLRTRPMLRFIDLAETAASRFGQNLRAEPYSSDLTLLEAALYAEREGRISDYGRGGCRHGTGATGASSQAAFSRLPLQR